MSKKYCKSDKRNASGETHVGFKLIPNFKNKNPPYLRKCGTGMRDVNDEQKQIIAAVKSVPELDKPFFNDKYLNHKYWQLALKNYNKEIELSVFVNKYKRFLLTFRNRALMSKGYGCQAELSHVTEYLFLDDMVFFCMQTLKRLPEDLSWGVITKAVYESILKGLITSRNILDIFRKNPKKIIRHYDFPHLNNETTDDNETDDDNNDNEMETNETDSNDECMEEEHLDEEFVDEEDESDEMNLWDADIEFVSTNNDGNELNAEDEMFVRSMLNLSDVECTIVDDNTSLTHDAMEYEQESTCQEKLTADDSFYGDLDCSVTMAQQQTNDNSLTSSMSEQSSAHAKSPIERIAKNFDALTDLQQNDISNFINELCTLPETEMKRSITLLPNFLKFFSH